MIENTNTPLFPQDPAPIDPITTTPAPNVAPAPPSEPTAPTAPAPDAAIPGFAPGSLCGIESEPVDEDVVNLSLGCLNELLSRHREPGSDKMEAAASYLANSEREMTLARCLLVCVHSFAEIATQNAQPAPEELPYHVRFVHGDESTLLGIVKTPEEGDRLINETRENMLKTGGDEAQKTIAEGKFTWVRENWTHVPE